MDVLNYQRARVLLHDFPIRNNYRMVNHQPNNVRKAIINHPNFHGSYNPFMVQLGMAYYFFTNIINHIYIYIYIHVPKCTID